MVYDVINNKTNYYCILIHYNKCCYYYCSSSFVFLECVRARSCYYHIIICILFLSDSSENDEYFFEIDEI